MEDPKESDETPSKKPPRINREAKHFLSILNHIKKNPDIKPSLPPKVTEKHDDKGENQVSENANVLETSKKYFGSESCTQPQSNIVSNKFQRKNSQPLHRHNSYAGRELGTNAQDHNLENNFQKSSHVYSGSIHRKVSDGQFSRDSQNNTAKWGRNSDDRFVKKFYPSERDSENYEIKKSSSDNRYSNNRCRRPAEDTDSFLDRNHAKNKSITRFDGQHARNSFSDGNDTRDKPYKSENRNNFSDRNFGKGKPYNSFGENNITSNFCSNQNYTNNKQHTRTAEAYKTVNNFSDRNHQNDRRLARAPENYNTGNTFLDEEYRNDKILGRSPENYPTYNCRSSLSSNSNGNEYSKHPNTHSSNSFSYTPKHFRFDFENYNFDNDNKTNDSEQSFDNVHGSAIDAEQTEPEDFCEFSGIRHHRQISNDSNTGQNLKITFQTNIEQESFESAKSPILCSESSKISELIPESPKLAKSPTLCIKSSKYPELLPESPEFGRSSTSCIASSKSPELMHSSSFSLEPSNVFVNSVVANDMCEQNFLLPVETEIDIVIPPPVPVKNNSNGNNHNELETSLDASLKSYFNNIHSPIEDSSTNDSETCCLRDPDPKQLARITDYINNVVKEKSVLSYLADKVVSYLNSLFKNYLEGNSIDVYGSYYSNLAITTSDINLVMKSDTVKPVRRGFMYEVYKVLSKEQGKFNVHPYEEGNSASRTQIHFSEPDQGINCRLAYLGKYAESYTQMGNCLKSVCTYDERVRTLIIAVKIWAEICLINEVEEGKLHPIGFIMMVIHFLQQYEKPILPVPIHFYKNLKIESPPPPTDSSVGELWIAFLKYYITTFNWVQDVVTITSKDPVSKKSKGWETVWMAIEDPYTGKNIAGSVTNSDIADSIKACFRASYDYFCSNPEDTESSDSTEEDCNEGTLSPRSQYSFQECVVDSSINFCEMCDELDDVCEECQKKIYVAPMASVPAMTENFLEKIREVLYTVYDKYMLTDNEVNERVEFVKQLQKDCRRIYSDAELHLFGSSANGFGFKKSDLDICMIFKTNKDSDKKVLSHPSDFRTKTSHATNGHVTKSGESLRGDRDAAKEETCQRVKNTVAVIKSIRTCLRRDRDFDHLTAIFNAQIPILKFFYKPKGWRGDICVDNSLAVHNSRLLYTYSLIDERCKILGCALKLLTKKALIAEVTEKALSSYSYLIMVIHFLQQTDPPVLPVLQDPKLHKNDYSLDDIVEGYNVWYYKGTHFEWCKNDTSVEQLWLNLLDYYCSYDPNQVVTIRQKEPLYLNEKQISARSFNIQDPFIEVKNLGLVVSSKKAQETENILRRARRLFRTPMQGLPSNVKDMEEYFFSTMSLTGRIHKEAHCDMCGQFGHERKDCKHNNLNRKFPVRRFSYKHPYRKGKYSHGK